MMPTKRSLSPSQEHENRQVPFLQSETLFSPFCKSCSDNALPKLSKILTTGTSNDHLKVGSHKIGNIVAAIEAEDSCTLCKFLVEATQLRSPNGTFQIYKTLEGRQSDVYLDCDPEPWFHKIGVSADIPSSPFAWLRTGSDAGQPLICITLREDVSRASSSSSSSSSRPIARRLYPAQRNSLEAFNGSVNIIKIQSWLNKCTINHHECNQTNDVRLPELTVIDVKTRQLVPYPEGERYAALSYVWGRWAMQQAVLFRDALHASDTARATLTLPSVLPQTIEDALVIVNDLGLRYFWVDLFCIDQTNEIEKQEQIEAMDQIYAGAWLTIVSVDGPTAEYGLPGASRSMLRTRQPKAQIPFGCLMATHIHSLWEHNGDSEWDLRAWTLQERLLSRRCLFFANAYYAMSCKEEQFHDLVNISTEPPTVCLKQQESFFREDGSSVDLDTEEWSFEQYGNLVSVFTGRKITDQRDIQNACWGSLKKVTSRTGVQFHHGLPKDHDKMLDSLLWMPHYEHVLQRRPGFPSWSWLGWIGRCEFSYWLHFQHSGNCHHELPDERRRQKKEDHYERLLGRRAATVVHDDRLTAPVIQLQTTICSFGVRRLRESGVLYNRSPKNPRKREAVGDHWALVKHDKDKLLNKVGEHQHFEDTYVAFRLDRPESNELIRQGNTADLIFIKYWPYIWDAKKVLSHFVSALVVIKDKNGSYSRLNSVMIPADEWLEADLHETTVTLI